MDERAKKIMVSVCMVTYHHEQYIQQAIESVLMQKCSFDYELLIGDDYSTDQTRKIINEYQKNNSEKIFPLLQNSNVGVRRNFLDILQSAKGKYIALLDGDDYWQDANKLQMQIDLLESRPDISLCFTNAELLSDSGEIYDLYIREGEMPEEVDTVHFLTTCSKVPSATACFRNNIAVQDWFNSFFYMDYAVFYLQSLNGNFFFLNKVTAVYRMNPMGVTKATSKIKLLNEKIITVAKLLEKAPPKHKKYLQTNLDEHREDLANFFAAERNFFRFILGYTLSLFHHPLRSVSEYQTTYYRLKHGVKGLIKGELIP